LDIYGKSWIHWKLWERQFIPWISRKGLRHSGKCYNRQCILQISREGLRHTGIGSSSSRYPRKVLKTGGIGSISYRHPGKVSDGGKCRNRQFLLWISREGLGYTGNCGRGS